MHYLFLNRPDRLMFVSAEPPTGSVDATAKAPPLILIATGSKRALTERLKRWSSLGYGGGCFFPYLEMSLDNIARAQVLFTPKRPKKKVEVAP